VFHALPPPTDDEIAAVLDQVHARVQRLLRRRGRSPEEPSPTDPIADQLPLVYRRELLVPSLGSRYKVISAEAGTAMGSTCTGRSLTNCTCGPIAPSTMRS
jgi:hypothetical protein